MLSLFELVYFYEEVLQRLQELNIDCISVENTVCQVLDMVNPKEKGEELMSFLTTKMFAKQFALVPVPPANSVHAIINFAL